MKELFTHLSMIVIMLTVPSVASAKNIYVAPDGNDNATGTIHNPLATLPAAYKKMASGDTVYFRGGTYYVTDSQVRVYKVFCD